MGVDGNVAVVVGDVTSLVVVVSSGCVTVAMAVDRCAADVAEVDDGPAARGSTGWAVDDMTAFINIMVAIM